VARITLEEVTKVFPGGTKAVDTLDLTIPDGELTVLVGPSGCGKTTLLRMIAGLEEATRGTIRIGDRIVNDVSPKDRDIAMVFQNYALYPHMTVYDNVAFGLRERRFKRAEIDRRVREVARTLALQDLLDRKPGLLSGGQQQRVAMGRAMVRQPAVFLLDEPLSNLDAKLRVQMRAEISSLQRGLNATMVYVTHDQIEAMTMGDRVAVLRSGRLEQVDTPDHLYDQPANLFVAGFIGSPAMNMVQGLVSEEADGLYVGVGEFRVSLENLPSLGVAFRQYVGRHIALGVRPEAFEDADFATNVHESDVLPVQVELRESLGHEVLLHFYVHASPVVNEHTRDLALDAGEESLQQLADEAASDTTRLVARVDPRTRVREGDVVRLVIDTARLHLFDLDSGQAIARGDAYSFGSPAERRDTRLSRQ
jgi:multiple sugar transport system ATP-binding protein